MKCPASLRSKPWPSCAISRIRLATSARSARRISNGSAALSHRHGNGSGKFQPSLRELEPKLPLGAFRQNRFLRCLFRMVLLIKILIMMGNV
jgi:hypothetical protein